MSAFNIAINTLFTDPNLRELAIYTPATGASRGSNQNVFVITQKQDTFASVGESFVASPTLMLDVLVEDCPYLGPGDKFIIGGVTCVVQGIPKRDSNNLTWRADLVCV